MHMHHAKCMCNENDFERDIMDGDVRSNPSKDLWKACCFLRHHTTVNAKAPYK